MSYDMKATFTPNCAQSTHSACAFSLLSYSKNTSLLLIASFLLPVLGLLIIVRLAQ